MKIQSVQVRALCLALVLILVPLAASADGPATLGPGWAQLGPLSPRPPDLFAIDPTWPSGRVLLGAHQPLTAEPDPFYSYILRSRDGGERWEILRGPGVGVSDLQLAPAPSGSGPVFLIDGDRFYAGQRALYRSADLGTTWQTALPLDPNAHATLTLSPTFATDQLAMLVSGGIAYRSLDGGQSFSAIDPANGASVRSIVFSPAYSADHRVFAVTDDAGGSDSGWQGVLASIDGAASWTALGSDGLSSPDGQPMLNVSLLIPSPNANRDSTLFVVASADDSQSGLFRSQDGGSSWQLVSGGEHTERGQVGFSLALSPTFADDGFAVMARNYSGPTPASHNCTLQTSTDGGSNWVVGAGPGSYEGCLDLTVDRVNGRLVATAWKSYGFLLSLDSDASWSGRLNFVEDRSHDQPLRYSRPRSSAPNGTFFVPTSQGLMAIGGGVQSTAGTVVCEPPLSGFGRVWQSEAIVRASLGCPLEAERAVVIRERTANGHRQFWTEDEQPRFFELVDHSLWLNLKREPFAADHTVNGATQRFEGGVMLFLPEPDGKRSILVTHGNTEWWEFPD